MKIIITGASGLIGKRLCKVLKQDGFDIEFLKRHDYNNTNLIINQNYIDKTHSNIYEWNRICIFHHHDIRGKITYDTIQKRVNRFKDIYENKI